MKIIIDDHSGCCNGVARAIKRAEEALAQNNTLNCLGPIVHNEAEIERLGKMGLRTVSIDDFPNLRGEKVLIRAHGEPPHTYHKAGIYSIELIDCTCPVVLALQKKIKSAYEQISVMGGKVVIFGKKGHAEVNGLVGQTHSNAVVVDSLARLKELMDNGTLTTEMPVELFSQTTKDPQEYEELGNYMTSIFPKGMVNIHNTICKQVTSRHHTLVDFAKKCDIIFFVCGKESSNGNVLYELCRSINPRSYRVEFARQIDRSLIKENDTVGICGAASTTRWQLESASEYILAEK